MWALHTSTRLQAWPNSTPATRSSASDARGWLQAPRVYFEPLGTPHLHTWTLHTRALATCGPSTRPDHLVQEAGSGDSTPSGHKSKFA